MSRDRGRCDRCQMRRMLFPDRLSSDHLCAWCMTILYGTGWRRGIYEHMT